MTATVTVNLRFDRKLFSLSGDVLTYDGKFVARFKYNPKTRTQFKRFLVNSMQVDAYFRRLEAGETPLAIVKEFGFVYTPKPRKTAAERLEARLARMIG